MQFKDLNLIEPILRSLVSENYVKATPIQAQAIPHILEGRDILGCAQTGTGKTAAFALPMLQLLDKSSSKKPEGQVAPQRRVIRALILTPTRELASQIGDSFTSYGKFLGLKHTVVYGGVKQHAQVRDLKSGVDILVATPGRLLDLMNQGYVDLAKIEIFVLDEADRMLDMGFIADIRKLIKIIPKTRQTLFFSATMPKDIKNLADSILSNPVRVEVTPVASTVDLVEQKVYYVDKRDKQSLLLKLLKSDRIGRVLIFTRTKHGADRIVRNLNHSSIHAEAIHSDKTQNARQNALNNFKGGRTRVLVATDIAARGIDVDDITHVINFDLPNVPETYVHRIGRTGRAGAAGIAISFCDTEEVSYLVDIEKTIRKELTVVEAHEFHLVMAPPEPAQKNGTRPGYQSPAKGTSMQARNRNRRRKNPGPGGGGSGGGQPKSNSPRPKASSN